MKFFPYSALILAFAFAFAACGGSEQAPESEMEMEVGAEETEIAGVSITIQPDGDNMMYAEETITVTAGTEVTLVLENTATAPVMIHNIVVLNSDSDEEATRVGMAALAAGEAMDYVPEDDAILAYTPMANPGETVEVTFTAPSEPGNYRFICTYPGHFATMQGVLVVQ
ncbi:MAG: plastocyanin/azurin family copper-binding protein [Bacteroidota bacterium]|nr:plastocyanin/azurin family copper-binding protein [Bacteroidota bacterium]MDE2673165.1 plastocyanin/azurin family copper-binding protein [Bacteroidota bacterium]MDE2769770.1 plastocyanin/azurin family copper-binding protein [Bacteroidota bacterium]